MRIWFALAEKRGLTVRELRQRMTNHEFKYHVALYSLHGLGYEYDDRLFARLERRMAMSASNNASRNLNDYMGNVFDLLEIEDEEFMEEVDDKLLDLKRRRASGEFDRPKK